MRRTFLHKWLLLPLCGWLTTACVKTPAVDNRININFSNGPATVINDSVARFTVRAYANSLYDPGDLIRSNYFSWLTATNTISNSTSSFNYTLRQVSIRAVTGADQPVSLMILVDKSVASNSINNNAYVQLLTQLRTYLSGQAGYEIAFAGFSAGNRAMPPFQTVGGRFAASMDDFGPDSLAQLFGPGTNGGEPNLVDGVDSALEFVNAKAAYPNRAILIITDPYSNVEDSTQIGPLSQKALAYHTSINVFDTYGADNYSALKMASNTGGMVCESVSNGNYLANDNEDLFIPAFFQYFTKGTYYEWVTEVDVEGSFFNQVTWALLSCRALTYDYGQADLTIFYER